MYDEGDNGINKPIITGLSRPALVQNWLSGIRGQKPVTESALYLNNKHYGIGIDDIHENAVGIAHAVESPYPALSP